MGLWLVHPPSHRCQCSSRTPRPHGCRGTGRRRKDCVERSGYRDQFRLEDRHTKCPYVPVVTLPHSSSLRSDMPRRRQVRNSRPSSHQVSEPSSRGAIEPLLNNRSVDAPPVPFARFANSLVPSTVGTNPSLPWGWLVMTMACSLSVFREGRGTNT